MGDTRTSDKSTPRTSAYVRQAHADWRIRRLYGRLVPEPVRRYLRSSVTLETRQRMRSSLGWAAASAQRVAEAARAAAVRRLGADVTLVRWGGRKCVATVVGGLTPVAARRRSADLVRQALDTHRIPYLFVRSTAPKRTRIAVPDEHRRRVATALAGALAATVCYVERAAGGRTPQRVSARTMEAAVADDYFVVGQLLTDPTHCLVLGTEWGCEVEFWRAAGGTLAAPRANPCAVVVPATDPTVAVQESVLSPFSPRDDANVLHYPSRKEFARPPYSDATFPIDVVYTWVDGMDPAWQRRRSEFAGDLYHPEAANAARYLSHDELRYSIRSVRMNLPWVRHIYLVTDQQVPRWLERESPGVAVVDHRDIFTDQAALPTFNSHAIESQLHHIDGLSEHFIYFNDDVCIGRPLVPEDFFLANGVSKFLPSSALVPMGEVSNDDIPSSVAGKNNRTLIAREFGALLTHKMWHVPHPLRRSVLWEIEKRFPDEHQRTAASRFRSATDISIPSSLYHYYAFLTGRAVPSRIGYSYFDLAASDTPGRLRELIARRDRHVFCVNDTTIHSQDSDLQRSLLTPFLEAYFPVPSIHEHKDSPRSSGELVTHRGGARRNS